MELLERFLQLIEDARQADETDETGDITVPCARQNLLHLLEVARRDSGLEVEGAWRLDGTVARRLGDHAGYIPPGGWRGVAALAAGADVLKASREGFQPVIDPDVLADWSTEQATRRLVEAFTRRLVPPTTAAGLFILLGVHPAWGVHLAHASNRAAAGRSPGARPDREMFPEPTLELVRRTVFGAINVVIGALRKLEPGRSYSVDALARLVDAACRAARSDAAGRLDELPDRGLPPFVDAPAVGPGADEDSNWRVVDFTAGDLLDAFLVPAGAARRFDDGRFCVVPGAFDDITVGPWAPERQHEELNLLLGGEADCRVA